MPRSTAATVEEYLAELPEERRAEVRAVYDVVRAHMPEGYGETIAWGMIAWGVPLARYPDTYNGQPLGYAALAAQKQYNSLYLMGAYMDPAQEARLREAFAREGKKLDMGKSCIHFRRADDLPLAAIGGIVASTPPDAFIAGYEAARAQRAKAKPARSAKPAKKAGTKKQ
jgi:uncharacterized protein YdhG (YjbR/CyaY superfamily)